MKGVARKTYCNLIVAGTPIISTTSKIQRILDIDGVNFDYVEHKMCFYCIQFY